MNKYDDIINLKRPISVKRSPMSIDNRAAQFAPFSALTGYKEAVKEIERITDNKKILSDGIKEIINEKLIYIKKNLKSVRDVTITYFVKDMKKSGGKYINVTGEVKKVDSDNFYVYMQNGSIIAFDDISNIDSEVFNYLEM